MSTHLERDAVAARTRAFDAPRSYLFDSAREPLLDGDSILERAVLLTGAVALR